MHPFSANKLCFDAGNPVLKKTGGRGSSRPGSGRQIPVFARGNPGRFDNAADLIDAALQAPEM